MVKTLENHKEHIYKHNQLYSSIIVKPDPTPLPADRRRKPYPTIRQFALKGCKTWGDYQIKRLDNVSRLYERNLMGHFMEI